MKIWIVYDSKYGNNKQIAEVIGKQFSEDGNDVHVHYAKIVKPQDAIDADMLLFGGPIHLGAITSTAKGWMEKYTKVLASNKRTLKKVAAWGTHIPDKPDTPPKYAWTANALKWKALMDGIAAEKRMPVVQGFNIKSVEGHDTLEDGWLNIVTDFVGRIKAL